MENSAVFVEGANILWRKIYLYFPELLGIYLFARTWSGVKRLALVEDDRKEFSFIIFVSSWLARRTRELQRNPNFISLSLHVKHFDVGGLWLNCQWNLIIKIFRTISSGSEEDMTTDCFIRDSPQRIMWKTFVTTTSREEDNDKTIKFYRVLL